MKYFNFFILLFVLTNGSYAQSISFEFLSSGTVNESCTSATDSSMNIQCYALEYTPGETGSLTSYTLGFIGTCSGAGSPYLETTSGSCVMSDNSTHLEACDGFQKFLLVLSGNTGAKEVIAGQATVVHQVCFDIPNGNSFTLEEDATSGLTFSIDPESGGPATTDIPGFTAEVFVNEYDCELSTVCSLNFGSDANKISFSSNANGNLVDAQNLENTFATPQSFDVYDELTESCVGPGGETDITFNFQIINTLDINGNGLIDTLAGQGHNIRQSNDGLHGSIPFNMDDNSESSSGDVRGYSIEVDFEDHIGVIADQLTVHLAGINLAATAFKSVALIFKDVAKNDYGSVTHQGFYSGENDLTGACNLTYTGDNFIISGTGVVVFQDTATVDKTLPCSIGMGLNGTTTSPSIHARIDAGLDSAAVVSGFRLIVYGEDISAPSSLDDGSGNSPDDGIRANSKTSTISNLEATIKGISITGCVFEQFALPLEWKDIKASKVDEGTFIEWSTQNEVNTDKFLIEWSRDAVDFQSIGELESRNNSRAETYDFIHESPVQGLNYYRVKQIDLDGRFTYSEYVYVEIENTTRFNIFPNPASNSLYITNPEKEKFNIFIYNAKGQLVLDTVTDSDAIDIRQLQDGYYFLTAKSSSHHFVSNFIKKEF